VVPILLHTDAQAIFSGVPFNYTFIVVIAVSLFVSFVSLALARIFLFEQVDPGAYFGRKADSFARRFSKKGTSA
jgi:hypothetical protein